jgi:hypothetical protein
MIGIADLDYLYLAVTKLTTHNYNNDNTVNPNPIRTGTGFFYANDDSKSFLVTNRHLIIDENELYHPHLLRLYLHTDDTDLTKNRTYDIELYNKLRRAWIQPGNSEADVIAIPMSDEFNNNYSGTCLNSKFLLPPENRLSVGQVVSIIGYPMGLWHDEKHNLPVIRSGTVASAYPVPYNGHPYFLIDARLHKGTSGSPVITNPPTKLMKNTEVSERTKTGWFGRDIYDEMRTQRFLLGINARTFPFIEKEQSLDLNAVYFASIIKEITK